MSAHPLTCPLDFVPFQNMLCLPNEGRSCISRKSHPWPWRLLSTHCVRTHQRPADSVLHTPRVMVGRIYFPQLLHPYAISLGCTLLSQVELVVELFGQVTMTTLCKDGHLGIELHASLKRLLRTWHHIPHDCSNSSSIQVTTNTLPYIIRVVGEINVLKAYGKRNLTTVYENICHYGISTSNLIVTVC